MFSSSNECPQKVRVGVAGAGQWGANLVRVAANLGLLDSVYDPDPVTVTTVRDSYPGISVVSDFAGLLSRPIDAVIIATPAQLHAEMCLTALSARKHVFVEKPLALSVKEGQRVADAAEAANLILFVGHLLLYHPAVSKLRYLVAQNEIGKVRHLRSRRVSLGRLRERENVWWSFAPHDVALMLALMGQEPASAVASQTSLRNTDLSDVAYADFKFTGGASAHLEVCWLDPDKSARLDVFGEFGVLTLTDSRRQSALFLRRFNVESTPSGVPTVLRGEESSIGFDEEEPLKAEIRAFAEALTSGRPFLTTARHGVAVLRSLAMAEESISNLRALA